MSASVLIVDDEKNIRLTVSATLKSMKCETDAAVNGEEALAKIAQKEYDLILLDIKMPGMDGMTALERIRKITPDVSVMMITAHGTVANAVDAMKLGAVDFLQKPFTPDEIRQAVSLVLDRRILDEKRVAEYDEFMELAKKYVERRDFLTAAECVRKAIAISPTRPEAFNFLGALTEIRGDVPEAQKLYRAATSLDPSYSPARENLSRTTSGRVQEHIHLE